MRRSELFVVLAALSLLAFAAGCADAGPTAEEEGATNSSITRSPNTAESHPYLKVSSADGETLTLATENAAYEDGALHVDDRVSLQIPKTFTRVIKAVLARTPELAGKAAYETDAHERIRHGSVFIGAFLNAYGRENERKDSTDREWSEEFTIPEGTVELLIVDEEGNHNFSVPVVGPTAASRRGDLRSIQKAFEGRIAAGTYAEIPETNCYEVRPYNRDTKGYGYPQQECRGDFSVPGVVLPVIGVWQGYATDVKPADVTDANANRYVFYAGSSNIGEAHEVRPQEFIWYYRDPAGALPGTLVPLAGAE